MYAVGWLLWNLFVGDPQPSARGTQPAPSKTQGAKTANVAKAKRSPVPSKEDKEDTELFKKIFHDLSSQSWVERHSLQCYNYYIFFCQAASWRPVEKMFNLIADGDHAAMVWKEWWLDLLTTLRNDKIEVNNAKAAEKKIGRVESQKLIDKYQRKIKKGIDEATNQLNEDLANEELRQNPEVDKILGYLAANWLHLTVFAEWSEVQMDLPDNRKLFVRVRKSTQNIAKLKLEDLVNDSTKAIFPIEEKEVCLKRLPGGKVTQVVKEIGMLRRPTFARATPVPVLQKTTCIADAEEAEDGEFTSMVPRLFRIVNLALQAVNKRLARKDSHPS